MPHQCTNCGTEFADGSQEMLSGCPECGGNKFQFKPARETGLRESTESADGASAEPPDRSNREYGEWPETAKRPAEKDDQPPADSTVESGQSAETRDQASPPRSPSDSEPAHGSGSADTPPTEADRPTTGDTNAPVAESGDTGPAESGDAGPPEPADATAAGSSDAAPAEPGDPSAAGSSDAAAPGADGEPTASETDEVDYEENAAQASARTEMVSSDELPDHEPQSQPDPTADPRSTDFERLREELNDQFESIRVVSPGTYELNLMELYDRQEYIISLREDGRYVIEMPGSWSSPDSE